MTMLISIAVAMVAGLLMTRVTNIFKLPDVTAYLIAGILIGPFVLGRLGIPGLGFTTYESIENLSLISNLALGFIAFAIGNEFRVSKLKTIGKKAVVIAICEGLCAVLFVVAALLVVHFIFPDKVSLPAALTLGAIASATAPAATLMVVRQFKAEGVVTEILLPVVALDDAVALICFAVASGASKGLISGEVDLVSIVANPLIVIVVSLLFGALLGWILAMVEKLFNSNRNRMVLVVGMIILTVALSMLEFKIGAVTISFSSLLVCMMLGTVFCNVCPVSNELMDKSEKWTGPLYCLFFVLSGAELHLDVFSEITMVLIGIVYILFRSAGKYLGAGISSKLMKCDPRVTKYLGITLLPQAGVALGMSLTASEVLGADGALIRNIVLFSVLIYELLGPTLAKIALTKAGDIKPQTMSKQELRQRHVDTHKAKKRS